MNVWPNDSGGWRRFRRRTFWTSLGISRIPTIAENSVLCCTAPLPVHYRSTQPLSMTDLAPNRHSPRMSCVICAYNEAPRIGAVLSVAWAHPLLGEIIVVDDGSTDGTAEIVERFPSVRLIRGGENRGKSAAMASGIAAATGEWLMLLDADLKGLTAECISALALPVLQGKAQVSLSLRQNSLLAFRAIGLDFVSGERVVRKTLLSEVLQEVHGMPRFGVEVFMNRRIIERRLPIAVTHWPRVTQARKTEKLGYWKGLRAEWRMIADLFKAVYPLALISQTFQLLCLRIDDHPRASFAARMKKVPD
ncbi:glycosyltransferase family 2 protein [Paraburkholderia agricolaris]